ncbi:MAG: hypothetical protein JW819_05685 [Candidatus Krumholzibacteriota bacterium]|nr:hypothetical protein [Candidatus Krumholzibacteriota bacterium]
MIVRLDPALADRVRAAWGLIDGVRHDEAPGFRAELARVESALRDRWAGRAPSEIPVLAPARTLYRRTGMDPTRTRPSSEALLRRVLQGKGLYRLDPVVDTGNLFSLAESLPLGLYDLDRIAGEEVVLRLGATDEAFDGIRKGPVHVAGRLCLADAAGPFGSPTSDSARCRVRDATARLLWLLYAPTDYEPARLAAQGEVLAAAFARWNGGRPGPVSLLP